MKVEQVRAHIREGLTYSQIGKLYGKSRSAVAGFVRRHIKGIKDPWKGKKAHVTPLAEALAREISLSKKPRLPSMPYVPKVTEDGKKWDDRDDERPKETPKDGGDRGKEARSREAPVVC